MTGPPRPSVAAVLWFLVFLSQSDLVKPLSGTNVCSKVESYDCQAAYSQRYTTRCGLWGGWSCTGYRIAYRPSTCQRTVYYCCTGYEESGDSCVPKSCGELDAPEHGGRVYISGGRYYGDVVTFWCSSGFVPVGSSERTCQADQTWSGTDFSCHRPCQREYILIEAEGTCLKFSDDRKTYQGARDSCREYGNGGKLVVIKTPAIDEFIETNLRNMGRNDSDGETWIGLDNLTDHGNFVWSDGSVLSTQDYQNWGIGQPDIDAERCVEIWPQSGYKWNNVRCHDSNYYICQKAVKCARPTAPENGAMTPSGSQQDPVKFFYQDTAEFSCNTGYGLTGQASISCREDGSWSSSVPTCTAVPCPQPTVPVNGEMTSGSDSDHGMVNFAYQDTVSFTCDLGYDLVGAESVTCQADSTWSNSFPTCTPVQCPMPETPANGAMTGLNFYQDVLEFTCASGYDLIGETRATCHADRTWSARAPTCTDINECVVSPWICGRNSACVNLEGSFDCKCLSGYEMGPGGCQDIDECSSKLTCSEDTFCVNDPGTYHCVCREGFTGDGVTCTEIVTTSTPASLTTVQSTTMTSVTPTTGKYTSPLTTTPTPTTTTTSTDTIPRSTTPNTPLMTTTATTQPGDAMEPEGRTTEPFPTSTVTFISHETPKSSSLPVSEATTADLQLDDPGEILDQLFPSGDSPSDDGKVDSTTCTEAMKTLAKLSRTPSAKDSTDKMVTIFNTVVTMCGTLPLDAQAEGGYVVGAMTDSIMQSVLEGASMKELAPKASAVVDTVASLMESGGSEPVTDDEDDVIALSRLPPRKRDEFQKQMEKKRQQKQKQQWALQREVTQRLQKDLDKMADALLGSVDSGERVELGSKAVQMVLDKSSGGRLGGAAVAAHAGRVTFPHAHALYSGGVTGDVEMKVVGYERNPYVWDDSAQDIKSSVVDIELKRPGGDTLEVKDLPEETTVVLKNAPDMFPAPRLVKYSPFPNDTMVFRTFSARRNQTYGVTVSLVSLYPAAVMYGKLGDFPNETDYDFQRDLNMDDFITETVPPHDDVQTAFTVLQPDTAVQNGTEEYTLGLQMDGCPPSGCLYSVHIVRLNCLFWDAGLDKEKGSWKGDGCRVSPASTLTHTVCLCNHL